MENSWAIRANVMDLTDPVNALSNHDLTVTDLSAPLSSIFPLLVKDQEQLGNSEITVIHNTNLLNATQPLSEVLTESSSSPSLTVVLKPRRVAPATSGEVPPRIPRGFFRRASKHHDKLLALLNDKQWLNELAVKCLAAEPDPFAFDLLHDRHMLAFVLRDKKTFQKLAAGHSCLYRAIYCVNDRLLASISAGASLSRALEVGGESAILSEHNFSLDQYNVPREEAETSTSDEEEEGGVNPLGLSGETNDAVGRGSNATDHRPSPRAAALSAPSRQPQLDLQTLRAAVAQASNALGHQQSANPVPSAPAFSPVTSEPMEVDGTTRPPPVERWAPQLAILAEMGITDNAAAAQALEATGGDIDFALQLLLG
uniref:UBA domain-containing protein n=1 Tax=Mesocestoides corti TaxID=53468 RepID=A0A5K3ENI6_MESCO